MQLNIDMILERLNLMPTTENMGAKGQSFTLEPLSPADRDSIILDLIRTTYKTELIKSGPHRIQDWEAGWRENLDEFQKSTNTGDLRPRYFSKSSIVRWDGDLYRAESDTENQLLRAIIQILSINYFESMKHVYEFGCGSGNNLVAISEVIEGKSLYGLDWATSSQEILGLLDGTNGSSIKGAPFDFFNPNHDFNLKPSSGVITVAALEQTGTNFKEFVSYLLLQKPNIVIHIEPIAELLRGERLLDSLSIDYFQARNYLSGFYDYLSALSENGALTIDLAIPSFLGSKFINGYSIVVWRPN